MRLSALASIGLLVLPPSLAAQQPDTTKADTTVHELPPIEVVGSIAPAAGPTIGSGVPARVTTLDESQVDAYEPRILSDALKTVAGFSTYDALAAATISPGRFISQRVRGSARFGTIEVGVRADLLLVDRNPFDDLSVLRAPSGVMAAGRWFDRAELVRLVKLR